MNDEYDYIDEPNYEANDDISPMYYEVVNYLKENGFNRSTIDVDIALNENDNSLYLTDFNNGDGDYSQRIYMKIDLDNTSVEDAKKIALDFYQQHNDSIATSNVGYSEYEFASINSEIKSKYGKSIEAFSKFDDHYEIYVDGKKIILDKDYNDEDLHKILLENQVIDENTIPESETSDTSPFFLDSDVRATVPESRPLETRKVYRETKQNYGISIDVDKFEKIKKDYDNNSKDIEQIKNDLKPMFSDKLLKYYNSLGKNPEKDVDSLVTDLDDLSKSIGDSLTAYESIDHNLGILFNQVVDEIFKVNKSISNKGNIENLGVDLSIQDRKLAIESILEGYKKTYDEMEKAFKEAYGEGIKFDTEKAYSLINLFSAFGMFNGLSSLNDKLDGVGPELLFSYNDVDGKRLKDGGFRVSSEFGTYGESQVALPNQWLNANSWKSIFTFCEENHVMDAFKDYVNGASWEESRLGSLFDESLSIMKDPLYPLYPKEYTNEEIFMYRYLGYSGKILTYGDFNTPYFNEDKKIWEDYKYITNDNYFEEKEIKNLSLGKNWYGPSMESMENPDVAWYKIKDGVDHTDAINSFKNYLAYRYDQIREAYDDLNYQLKDCTIKQNQLMSLGSSIYELEHYKDLIVYEEDKKDLKYLDYLYLDYTKNEYKKYLPENSDYMSQSELALYVMYKKTGDVAKASQYYSALKDQITRRKGFEIAALRINGWNQNGFDLLDVTNSGWNGFTDGLGRFSEGFTAWFRNGDFTVNEYTAMYMSSILSEKNVYTSNLSEAAKLSLLGNYKVLSSVGNMFIPATVNLVGKVASAATDNPLIAKAASVASSALLGASAGGHSYTEALRKGYEGSAATLYGIIGGASEVMFEKALGSIMGENAATDYFGKLFGKQLGGMVSEAGEEFLQTYFDAAVKSVIFGEPMVLGELSEEALESAIMGFMTAGIMNAAGSGIELATDIVINAHNQNITLKKGHYDSIDSMIPENVKANLTITAQNVDQLSRIGAEIIGVDANGDYVVKARTGEKFTLSEFALRPEIYEGRMNLNLTPEEQKAYKIAHANFGDVVEIEDGAYIVKTQDGLKRATNLDELIELQTGEKAKGIMQIFGEDSDVDLNDWMQFKDEKTGKIDYKKLSEYLISKNKVSKNALEAQAIYTIEQMYKASNGNIANFNEMIAELPDNSQIAMFLKDMTAKYNEGNENAVRLYNQFFQNFRDHGFNHALNVAAYVAQLSKSKGINVDVNTALYSALAHDYGMKGGYHYIQEESDSVKILSQFLKNNGIAVPEIKGVVTLENINKALTDNLGAQKAQEIMSQYSKGKTVSIESLRSLSSNFDSNSKEAASWAFQLDNMTRKNHPLNSAISLLTEGYIPDGMDPNVVALIAMTHSKSTSGIKHFDSQTEWHAAVDKLSAAVNQYNQENGTNHQVDVDGLKKLISDPTSFKQMVDTALMVRDGDAWATVVYGDENLLMQDRGMTRVVEKPGQSRGNDYNKIVGTLDEELDSFDDYRVDPYSGELTSEKVTVAVSKKIHAGEGNLKFGNNSSYDGKNYAASVMPVDANKYPHSTFAAIEERIGEVNTYTNAETRFFEIVLPIEAKNTALGIWYEMELGRLKTELSNKNLVECNKGKISLDTYNKQRVFYGNIQIRYE